MPYLAVLKKAKYPESSISELLVMFLSTSQASLQFRGQAQKTEQSQQCICILLNSKCYHDYLSITFSRLKVIYLSLYNLELHNNLKLDAGCYGEERSL